MQSWRRRQLLKTTTFPRRLTKVRTPEATTQLRREVCGLRLGPTVPGRWEFTSGNWGINVASSI